MFENIPEELKIDGLWCGWKLCERGKVPYNLVTGSYAKANDKSTFHPFKIALENISKYYAFDKDGKQIGGIGLGVFNGYSAIDIDHCIDEDGNLSDMATDIIDYCNSYTEISPSGTGIRIIFKTKSELNKIYYYVNNSNIGLEIYLSDQTSKYVTITGNVKMKASIVDIDISYILDKYMKKGTMSVQHDTDTGEVVDSETKDFNINHYDKDIILKELWYSDAPGSGDNESELDLKLCNKLAYYLKGNFSAINDAFMSSPYYQSKDDAHIKKWEIRTDYREITIKKSIKLYQSNDNGNYTLTDTGNAHRFVDRYGSVVRYNVDNNMWMYYNGEFWQHDVYNNVRNFAESIAEELRMKANTVSYEEERKAILSNVKRILQSNGKTSLLKESEHVGDIPVTNQSFDTDKYLLNTSSGVVDLRSGDIKAHDKALMLSQYTSYEVDMKNEPVKWLEFLNDIFENDKEVIKYMQRVIGYSLTGETTEQCMFFLFGDGSNGKSLLLDVVNEAIGSYGATSNADILLEKYNKAQGNLGDIARLKGIRFVVTDEAKHNDKLNESAIKTYTSGIGNIVARFLYGKEFEFAPIMKIFMSSNYKPRITGTDHGIWRRIKVIPFNKVIPDEQQDKHLKQKLIKEMPQILGWMIKGCLLWQRYGLNEPNKLRDAHKDYRNEMDIVQRWVNECCFVEATEFEKSSDLFDNFSEYVQKNKEYQLSHTMFGRNMSKKFTKGRYGGKTVYRGLMLRPNEGDNISKKEYEEI
jgi:putative DNA primase/helicase